MGQRASVGPAVRGDVRSRDDDRGAGAHPVGASRALDLGVGAGIEIVATFLGGTTGSGGGGTRGTIHEDEGNLDRGYSAVDGWTTRRGRGEDGAVPRGAQQHIARQ